MRRQNITEKPKNFFDTWVKLLKYSRNHWVGLLFAVLFAAGGNILTIIGPNRLAAMTDIVSEGIENSVNMEAVTRIGLSLIVIYAFSGLFNLLQGWIMVTVTQTISQRLRSDISYKINKLPMSYFSKTTVGDTLSRVTNDVDTIGRALNMSVQNLLSSGTCLLYTF